MTTNILRRLCKDEFIIPARLVYLDSAATCLQPARVLDAMDSFNKKAFAPIHRSMYPRGEYATKLFEDARAQISKHVAANPKNVVITRGATHALNMLANSLALAHENDWKGKKIIVSIAEHHANFLPWQQLAKRVGAKLQVIGLVANDVDTNSILAQIDDGTVLVAIAHVSNVLGTTIDAEKICKKSAKTITIIDGTQAVGHITVDVKQIKCDAYIWSAHKMYGPTGVGAMYLSDRMLTLPPSELGGHIISTVDANAATYQEGTARFEAGSPPSSQAIGFGAASAMLDSIGMKTIHDYEESIYRHAIFELSKITYIKIISAKHDGTGVISFTMDNAHAHDVAYLLGKKGICVRAGHHCAMPLHTAMDIVASIRISIGIYTTKGDIDQLCKELKATHEVFK